MLTHEIHRATFKTLFGVHKNIAAFDDDLCTKSFESFEMKIHGSVSNDTTTRQGHRAFFEASGKRAENTDARTHFPHKIVGGDGFDLLRFHHDHTAGALHFGAELAKNADHVVGITQVRDAADGAGIPG